MPNKKTKYIWSNEMCHLKSNTAIMKKVKAKQLILGHGTEVNKLPIRGEISLIKKISRITTKNKYIF